MISFHACSALGIVFAKYSAAQNSKFMLSTLVDIWARERTILFPGEPSTNVVVRMLAIPCLLFYFRRLS